jgi:hypothetical protein
METKVKALIEKQKLENERRCVKLQETSCLDYNRAILVHKYNLTLDFIIQLKTLLK